LREAATTVTADAVRAAVGAAVGSGEITRT
jgi:hypothetical protein